MITKRMEIKIPTGLDPSTIALQGRRLLYLLPGMMNSRP